MRKKSSLSIKVGKCGLSLFYYKSEGNFYSYFYPFPEEIRNNPELVFPFISENLKGILKENRIRENKVNIIIEEDFDWILYNFSILPTLPKNEILKILEWELKKYFNTDIIVDFIVIGEIEEKGIKKQNVFSFGVVKYEFENLIKAFKKANLKVLKTTFSFDASFSVIKEISKEEKVYLFLDIGRNRTNLLFVENGKILYGKKVNIGINDFCKNLIKETNISLEKVKEIIEKEDLFKDQKLFSIIQFCVENLIKEINFAINSFYLLYPDKKISIIILFGQSEKLKNIDEHLESSLSIPVEILKFKNVENSFIDCYGSITSDTIFDFKIEREPIKISLKIFLPTILFLILIYSSTLTIEKKIIQKINKEITTKEKYDIKFYDYYYPEILLEIATYIPKDSYIENVNFQENKIEINGFSEKEESLNEFFKNIRNISYFKKVNFSSNRQEEGINFKIVGELNEKIQNF